MKIGVVGAAMAVAAGCGATPDSPAPGTSPVVSVAEDLCALYEPCCAADGFPGDQATCRAIFGYVRPADEAAALQCLEDMRRAAKAAGFCASVGTAPRPSSCIQAFLQHADNRWGGPAAPGEACNDDSVCAPSANGRVLCVRSWEDDPARPSFCQLLERSSDGDPCTGTVDLYTWTAVDADDSSSLPMCYVADSLYCDATTKTCQPYSGVGGPCNDFGCRAGAFCLGGVCSPLVELGGDCSLGSGACGAAADCSSDLVCEPDAENGEACWSWGQCRSGHCDIGGTCEPVPTAGFGLSLLCQ